MIILNVGYSLVRDICRLIVYFERDKVSRVCSFIVAGIFALCAAVLLLTIIIIPCFYTCKARKNGYITYGCCPSTKQKKILALSSINTDKEDTQCSTFITEGFLLSCELTAGLLYYIGDNLVLLLIEFFSGNESMLTIVKQCSVSVLLVAGLLYLIPLGKDVANGLKYMYGKKRGKNPDILSSFDDAPLWAQAQVPILLFTQNLTRVDTLYTAVTLGKKFSDNDCDIYRNTAYEVIAWFQWGSLTLTILVILVAMALWNAHQRKKSIIRTNKFKTKKNKENPCKDKEGCRTVYVIVMQLINCFVVAALYASYILADNAFPLRCAPNVKVTGFIRVALLWIVVSGSIIYISVFLVTSSNWGRIKKKTSKLSVSRAKRKSF